MPKATYDPILLGTTATRTSIPAVVGAFRMSQKSFWKHTELGISRLPPEMVEKMPHVVAVKGICNFGFWKVGVTGQESVWVWRNMGEWKRTGMCQNVRLHLMQETCSGWYLFRSKPTHLLCQLGLALATCHRFKETHWQLNGLFGVKEIIVPFPSDASWLPPPPEGSAFCFGAAEWWGKVGKRVGCQWE